MTLICGSEKVKEWQKISDAQSLYHLKIFLSEKGYFKVLTQAAGSKTLVLIHEKTQVTSWELLGSDELPASKFKRILGQTLTPQLLDNITDRITLAFQNRGYGCPIVRTTANSDSGTVVTRVQTGKRMRVQSIEREPVEGIETEVLSRYEAFHLGDWFQKDFLRLTEMRIMNDNILQDSHFEVKCREDGVHLKQKSVAGPPRLFLFGVGLNTEKGPFAKVSWKHSRLGKNASRMGASISGSLNEQRLDLFSDYYFNGKLTRLLLRPSVLVSHETEKNYERYVGELRLTPVTTWDNSWLGAQFSFGPTLNFEKTVVGIGPKDTKFMASFFGLILQSHSFELNESAPRSGFQVNLNALTAIQSVFSRVSASKFTLKFTHLWNVMDWDPHIVVLGLRGAVASTFTNEEIRSSDVLPSSFRHFLGGSKDLRGFGRLELPAPEGALSSVYLSGEARLANTLPWNLQPFTFVDAGMTGPKSTELDNKIYWSPGLGMRWESPIGSFRGTVARRIISPETVVPDSRWNFYFSYGEEF